MWCARDVAVRQHRGGPLRPGSRHQLSSSVGKRGGKDRLTTLVQKRTGPDQTFLPHLVEPSSNMIGGLLRGVAAPRDRYRRNAVSLVRYNG